MANKSKAQKEKAKREVELKDLVDKFEKLYGCDDAKLAVWQQLCKDLSEPEGNTITQCKNVSQGQFFSADKETC